MTPTRPPVSSGTTRTTKATGAEPVRSFMPQVYAGGRHRNITGSDSGPRGRWNAMIKFGPTGHAARSMTRLHLALLGSFDARLDPGGRLTLARQKVAALLAFLASTPGRLHRRDTLAALLWADAPSPRARQSLRTALAELRLALAPVSSCLIERGDAVGLDSDA